MGTYITMEGRFSYKKEDERKLKEKLVEEMLYGGYWAVGDFVSKDDEDYDDVEDMDDGDTAEYIAGKLGIEDILDILTQERRDNLLDSDDGENASYGVSYSDDCPYDYPEELDGVFESAAPCLLDDSYMNIRYDDEGENYVFMKVKDGECVHGTRLGIDRYKDEAFASGTDLMDFVTEADNYLRSLDTEELNKAAEALNDACSMEDVFMALVGRKTLKKEA